MDLQKTHDDLSQRKAIIDVQIIQVEKQLENLIATKHQLEGGLVVARAMLTSSGVTAVDPSNPSTWPWFSTLTLPNRLARRKVEKLRRAS